MKTAPIRIFFAALSLALAACAGVPTTVEEARKRFAEGRGEEALAVLKKAASEEPNDVALRSEYIRLRDLVMAQWLAQAEMLREAGQFEAAEALYRRVRNQDEANARAASGLAQLELHRRHRALIARAEQLVKDEKHREAQDVLRPVLGENPQDRDARRLQRLIDEKLVKPVVVSAELQPTTTKPVSLELREVTLRSLFDMLQRATGLNFVLDRDVRTDQRTSIAVHNATVEEAIKVVLLANSLERKVLNPTTVFVFPNTPQKLREHQELVVRSFYLANADVKQTATMIRAVLRTRDLFIDEKIGLIVIKDTPAAIRLAERLIAAQDLAEPEVMLEVEVLEVSRNRLLELGIRFPNSLAVGIMGAAGVAGTVTLPEWLNRGSEIVRLSFTDPLFLLSLKQQDGVTNVLANPRIRVKNKEKARIHIGDRLPVITTTAAVAGGFVSETVQYLDVGLKLEVEPIIYLEHEVGIKVGLEVSNIVREVRSTSSLNYQIGTRNAATNLRLRDGETQVLAGLISDDTRRLADRVPGLGDLPVVGRLFSHTRDSTNRTEIVLLITPRLMRTLARPEAGAMEFAAGTEGATAAPRLALPPIPGIAPPAPAPAPTEAPPRVSPTPDEGEGAVTPEKKPAAPTIVPFGGVKPPGRQ